MTKQSKNKLAEQQEVKVDAKGSLGLLALGYVGLKKWREVREQWKRSTSGSPEKKEK